MDARLSLEAIRGLLIVGVLLGWALAAGPGDFDLCIAGGCGKASMAAGLLMTEATLLLALLFLLTPRSTFSPGPGRMTY